MSALGYAEEMRLRTAFPRLFALADDLLENTTPPR